MQQVKEWEKWHQSFDMFQGQMKKMMTKWDYIVQKGIIRDNCDEFLWCIDGWQNKMQRGQMGNKKFTDIGAFYEDREGYKLQKGINGIDECINSDSFYSHREGYKMQLRLVFHGFETLGIYLHILRGEFDHDLDWPFHHEIKFDLLNQETGLSHFHRNVNPKDYPEAKELLQPPHGNDGIRFISIYLPDRTGNADLFTRNQIRIKVTPKINP